MSVRHIPFKEVPVGARFELPGAAWLKVSTRTARLNGNGQWFYFGQNEIVRIDASELDQPGVTPDA